jgi:hypothetical protein
MRQLFDSLALILRNNVRALSLRTALLELLDFRHVTGSMNENQTQHKIFTGIRTGTCKTILTKSGPEIFH